MSASPVHVPPSPALFSRVAAPYAFTVSFNYDLGRETIGRETIDVVTNYAFTVNYNYDVGRETIDVVTNSTQTMPICYALISAWRERGEP